jgi:hypothetical protein
MALKSENLPVFKQISKSHFYIFQKPLDSKNIDEITWKANWFRLMSKLLNQFKKVVAKVQDDIDFFAGQLQLNCML